MRMIDTMHKLRSKYAGVENFHIPGCVDTSVRIKDGLLRFDMPDDSSFKHPAKMRLNWQNNPGNPLLTVHYVTPPFEGVALSAREFRTGSVCTRLALLATSKDTTILAGSLERDDAGTHVDYEDLGQQIGFYADEIADSMDVVVLNKLVRYEPYILAGDSPF